MQKRILISVSCLVVTALFLTSTINQPSYAQDSEPTSIPILPDATEDSAAPVAPIVAPPSVEQPQPLPESTADPEATPAVDTPAEEVAIDTNVCPIGVDDSFTAVEILCTDTASGNSCIGNGTVNASFSGSIEGTFSQANDRVALTSLDRIQLVSGTTWTVIRAELQLATTDGGDIAQTTMFAYGNLTLTDTGQVASGAGRDGTVLAANGMNVRRAPGAAGVVVWQLQGGQQIVVTGISPDREWLRMVIPNEFAGTGWVYAPYIEVAGGNETLEVVNENSPVPDLTPPQFAPAQSYELLSELPPTDCDPAAPLSGLLLQSPSGLPDAVRLQINSAEIQISGTVFIQALIGEQLRVSVLEGQAIVLANGGEATATANERINVPLDINLVVNGTPQTEAFDSAELADVPTRLLPRGIAFGIENFDTTEVDTAPEDTTTESSEAEEESNTNFGTPQPTTESSTATCTLTAPDENRNIRAGASTEFETVQVLQAGESIEADGQAIGELNLTWYRTVNGGWIRIDTIDASVGCDTLPVVETPDLPEPIDTPETETTASLSSSTLAPLVCDGSAITGSATSTGEETSIAIGGTWTASSGTTVTFNTQGGMLRPEFGSYIKLITEDGTELATSGESVSLTYTVTADTVFEARFSAANNDLVVVAASCN
ncbi:MAG: hypothetical protein AAF846_27280 [Chloroflexota bacterium]